MMSNNTKSQNKRRLNTITSPKDLIHRFCTVCHIQLVYDDLKNTYKCPRCGCSTVLQNTEPDTKIRANFPTYNQGDPSNRKHIFQSKTESLPRSEQFIKKNMEKRNQEELNDPYLNMLKQNNQIRITNVEYYSVEDFEDSYRQYDP